ncbi:Pyridoxal phosphate homeostasis protein [Sesbania bispinosa]|nr:Pyridoxal phosphate homeostasis protein [Sesbania bispinosa]
MTSPVVAEGAAVAAFRSVMLRVQQAAERSGSKPDRVRVVAVSKTKPVSMIRQLYDAGHRCFGENYVQKSLRSSSASTRRAVAFHWAFAEQQSQNTFGTLRLGEHYPRMLYAGGVPNLAMVEGVDNHKVANFLDRTVSSLGRDPLKVLVQVNTSGEASKSGVEPSECVELAKHVKYSCPNLVFSGLMTIGMLDYTSTPQNFQALSNCRTEVCKALEMEEEQCELSWACLIEMGSTNVRIGSTIFGPREYAKKQ